MGTPGGYHENIGGYPKSRYNCCISFHYYGWKICFKLASIFIHCLLSDASSLLDTYM